MIQVHDVIVERNQPTEYLLKQEARAGIERRAFNASGDGDAEGIRALHRSDPYATADRRMPSP